MDAVLVMIVDHVVARRAAGQEVSDDLRALAGVIDLMQRMYEDQDREAGFEEAMEAWVDCLRDEREAEED